MTSILDFMNRLLKEYPILLPIGLSEDEKDTHEFKRVFTRWSLSVKTVLQHAGLENFLAEYEQTAVEGGHDAWRLTSMAGVLESARDCFEAGFTGKLRYLLHAEMFDSLTAQAKELLKTGHKLPAAVLLRIVIERGLRDQGEKAGVPNWDKAQASAVNDALKNASVFSMPKWRQVQSLLDIGNAAAHGKDGDFTDEDVQRMIVFAETSCV